MSIISSEEIKCQYPYHLMYFMMLLKLTTPENKFYYHALVLVNFMFKPSTMDFELLSNQNNSMSRIFKKYNQFVIKQMSLAFPK